MKKQSKVFTNLLTYLKVFLSITFISYLVSVVYIFIMMANHDLPLEQRLKDSLITPILAVITGLMVLGVNL